MTLKIHFLVDYFNSPESIDNRGFSYLLWDLSRGQN